MMPKDLISEQEWKRYKRHLQLPGFDHNAQIKLKESSVLVVGAGGLGCPILLYLAAAGIGKIGIIDFDTVEIENLHRQILYNEGDIGKFKAEVAAEKIRNLQPTAEVIVFNKSIDYQNVSLIVPAFEIIVDGSDNFATRYLLNDACVLYHKPYIYGAVFQFEGQVSSFNISLKEGIRSCNYRNIYPDPPTIGVIPSCNEGGVLGILPGIIGCVQALEVIKLITGLGDLIINETWIFDALTMESHKIKISPTSPVKIKQIVPLQHHCLPTQVPEIAYHDIISLYQTEYQLIDVRDESERNLFHIGGIHIPLQTLKEKFPTLGKIDKKIIFYCQSGKRSKEAVQWIQQMSKGQILPLSLKGGLNAIT
jgi:adenylyltransferase/sulfurtransferase